MLAATICLGQLGLSTHALVPSSLTSRSMQTSLFASATVEASTKDDLDDLDDLDSVEFPPPLSQLDRIQRSAIFWSKALPIVANYYGLIGSLKLQELLGENPSEESIEVCMKWN